MVKYESIVKWFNEQIKTGAFKPNDRLPSEKALSQQFGVSRQTVRKALEVLEGQGEVRSRQGSGTFVQGTNTIKPSDSKRIATVTTYIDNYIFPKILQGVGKVLEENGYHMQLSFTNNKVFKEEVILKELLKQELSGVIVETTKSALPNPNIELYRKLQKKGVPIIFIHSIYPELEAPIVSMQDEVIGKELVEYLIENGHRNIGGLFKSDDGQGIKRYSGYAKHLVESGLKLRDNRVVWVDTEDAKDFSLIEKKVLTRFKNCTAVVCYNDQIAASLIDIFVKNNIRVPEDVSIVSVDNTNLATYTNIQLTSYNHPKERFGEKVASLMIEMIDTKSICRSYEFVETLVERASVAKIDTQINFV